MVVEITKDDREIFEEVWKDGFSARDIDSLVCLTGLNKEKVREMRV
jgi:uncharacterized protein (UPF0335 family)